MHSFTLFVWNVIERSLNFMLTTFINCCNIVKFGVCHGIYHEDLSVIWETIS